MEEADGRRNENGNSTPAEQSTDEWVKSEKKNQ